MSKHLKELALQLPMELVGKHQNERARIVAATGDLLDKLRLLVGTGEAGEDTIREYMDMRLYLLEQMDMTAGAEAEAHVLRSQLSEVTESHNDLVDAIKNADTTHDLLNDYKDDIHEAIGMWFEFDLLNQIADVSDSDREFAAELRDAMTGGYIAPERRKPVAQKLMRIAAQVANSIPEDE